MYTRPNDHASFATLLRLARNEKMEVRPVAVEKIKILLKNGIDPNKCEKEFLTPLGLALCHHEIINVDVVKLLLESGANPNLRYTGREQDHIVATIVYHFFDEYFNCYMSDNRVEQLKIFYKERNSTMLDSIKLLIEHGIDLHATIDPNTYHMENKEMTVIDYIKHVIDKNIKYECEHEKIEQLSKMVDYYAEKVQDASRKMKM